MNYSNVTGVVGSECSILASTALSSSTTVTMAWRARDNDENGSAFIPGAGTASSNWSKVLPKGTQWLASDVDDIEGIPTDTTFAMQMSYDDDINTLLDHGTTTTVSGAYIAKLVNGINGAVWENAVLANSNSGADAQTPANNPAISSGTESLATFLGDYYLNGDYTLNQLAGSWGVDLANHQSWAIVNGGGGQFAVVSEPSTCVLLGAGVTGLFVYRVRRKARKKFTQA